MGIWTLAKPTPPAIFTPAILLYHLLPLHAPLTLFILDAPFGRFNQSKSIFNVNGNVAWFAMEIVAPATLLWTLYHTSQRLNNNSTILAGLYVVHYIHRAVLSPLVLSPKRSSLNIVVPFTAGIYNVLNAYCLAIGLAYYPADTGSRTLWCLAGWAAGLLGNVYHDEILNDLRRPEEKRLVSTIPKEELEKDKKAGNGRYAIPRGGLYHFVSFPNYLCEWFEWTCYAFAASPSIFINLPSRAAVTGLPTWLGGVLNYLPWLPTKVLHPAWMFVLFEISAMLPRAIRGQRWNRQTWKERYPKNRKVVIPWLF